MEPQSTRILRIASLAAVLAAGIACISADWFMLYNESFWLDEFMTVDMVNLPLAQMIPATMADVHPPLYYLIVKAFLAVFGSGHFVWRVASFAPMFLVVALAAFWLRPRFGTGPALVLLAFAFFGRESLVHMAEARMYQWLFLFVLVFGCAACEVLRSGARARRAWGVLFVSGLCTAYTQYFSLITVALLYLLLLAALALNKFPLRPWLLCVGLSAAAYLPWLIPLLRYLGNSVKNFALYDASSWSSTLEQPFGEGAAATALLLIYTAVTLACTVQGLRGEFTAAHFLVAGSFLAALGTAAVGQAASALIRPVWVARYLFAALGLVWLSFGTGLCLLAGRVRGTVLCAVLAAAALGLNLPDYAERRATIAECNRQVEESLAYVEELYQPGDCLVSDFGDNADEGVLEFYFPGKKVVSYEDTEAWMDGEHSAFYFTRLEEDPAIYPEGLEEKMAEHGMCVYYWKSVRIGAVYPLLYYITPLQ